MAVSKLDKRFLDRGIIEYHHLASWFQLSIFLVVVGTVFASLVWFFGMVFMPGRVEGQYFSIVKTILMFLLNANSIVLAVQYSSGQYLLWWTARRLKIDRQTAIKAILEYRIIKEVGNLEFNRMTPEEFQEWMTRKELAQSFTQVLKGALDIKEFERMVREDKTRL